MSILLKRLPTKKGKSIRKECSILQHDKNVPVGNDLYDNDM